MKWCMMSFLWILTQIIHIEILWRKYVLRGDYLRYDHWIRTMYWSLMGSPMGPAPKTVTASFLNQPEDISLPLMERAPEDFFLSCTDVYGPVLIQTQSGLSSSDMKSSWLAWLRIDHKMSLPFANLPILHSFFLLCNVP